MLTDANPIIVGNVTTVDNRRIENSLQELIATFNLTQARGHRHPSIFDSRRDIDDECGYPKTSDLKVDDYRDMYDREAIAARVVEILAKECWSTQPSIEETKDPTDQTEFELAVDNLSMQIMKGSKYAGEGNCIWDYLLRTDILSGIGAFGLLLIGVDDGKDLREPVEPRENSELLFLRAFDQSMVDITVYESDLASPRFGQPVMYNITLNDPKDLTQGSGLGAAQSTHAVHWSRVIHVADNLASSEIWGIPRLRPVFNRIYDLRKLYSGSAEMFWKGAFPGLSIETHPQLGGDVSINIEKMRDELEQYMTGLQRYLVLKGMEANSLTPQVADPSKHIEAQIDAICIRLGIPKRIFLGSERGELASSQDDKAWKKRLAHRQETHITPRIIVPFIDRLINIGILPEPESYNVVWPDLTVVSDEEKSKVAQVFADAMAKYIQGDVETLIPPDHFLEKFIGLSRDDVETIMEDAVSRLEDDDTTIESPLLGFVGGIRGMTELFRAHQDGSVSEETVKEMIKLFYKLSDEEATAVVADGLPDQAEFIDRISKRQTTSFPRGEEG